MTWVQTTAKHIISDMNADYADKGGPKNSMVLTDIGPPQRPNDDSLTYRLTIRDSETGTDNQLTLVICLTDGSAYLSNGYNRVSPMYRLELRHDPNYGGVPD